MLQITDYTGADQYDQCLHCARKLDAKPTRDHVPSRGLLASPYPDNLPTVDICPECNNGFSDDERYLFLLLDCVLSGSADPNDQSDLRVTERLREAPGLARRIADQQVLTLPLDDETVWWEPESARINTVIVKNARGHVMYEAGVPLHRQPDLVAFSALSILTAEQRQEFERGAGDSAHGVLLPEVGTRALARAFTPDVVDGWVVVQPSRYRFAVDTGDSAVRVRSVIREYLATETIWCLD
ncbi:hypothetical protein K8O93_18760 [Gordonia bronchialis]|uniref:hypothetical protein n=1 Tax=Gordonia bronchialis TaxID=2054 RepID=UPI001CBC513B|nr:hypothetical protein [Gordonia bronchialis]UAK37188.1 hypothetical protein K8O93_18760 [Gordonia bronchialis]